MTKAEIILAYLREGRELIAGIISLAKYIIPALITWHLQPPKYMAKKDGEK